MPTWCAGWIYPKDMMAGYGGPRGSPAKLPSSWTAGDEARVPAALLDLFHKLPKSSAGLLQTLKAPDGTVTRHGLIVLTIQLEQVRRDLNNMQNI